MTAETVTVNRNP